MGRIDVYDTLAIEVVRAKGSRFSYLPLTGYHDRSAGNNLSASREFDIKVLPGKRKAVQAFTHQLARWKYTQASVFGHDSMSFKSAGLAILIRVEFSDVLNRDHTAWFLTLDDFTRVGQLPVVPVDSEIVEDVFDEWQYEDAIDPSTKFTASFVRHVARKIADNEFGMIESIYLKLKWS